jgi:hypothetical protein
MSDLTMARPDIPGNVRVPIWGFRKKSGMVIAHFKKRSTPLPVFKKKFAKVTELS